jgi:hypothetical protein
MTEMRIQRLGAAVSRCRMSLELSDRPAWTYADIERAHDAADAGIPPSERIRDGCVMSDGVTTGRRSPIVGLPPSAVPSFAKSLIVGARRRVSDAAQAGCVL